MGWNTNLAASVIVGEKPLRWLQSCQENLIRNPHFRMEIEISVDP